MKQKRERERMSEECHDYHEPHKILHRHRHTHKYIFVIDENDIALFDSNRE
jgi:hypothetical protein